MLSKPANLYQSKEFQDAISKKNRIKRTLPIVIFTIHIFAAIIVPALVMYYSATPKLLSAGTILDAILMLQIVTLPMFLDPDSDNANFIRIQSYISLTAIILGTIGIVAVLNKFVSNVISLIFRSIPYVLGTILVLAVFVIIGAMITSLIKWIAWNGYSNTFIAISLKGNIKRFNSIDEIQEKLPQNATLEEVVSKLEQYETIIKTEKDKNPFW